MKGNPIRSLRSADKPVLTVIKWFRVIYQGFELINV